MALHWFIDSRARLIVDAPTLVARLIGILASAKRPLRLFNNVVSAKHWLDNLAVPAA
jgi:hypothetical protein